MERIYWICVENRPALRVGLVVLVLCLVELGLTYVKSSSIAEWRAFSRNVRRTFHVPSGVRSNVPFLSACLHPELNSKGRTTSTSQNSRTTASSPLRYSGPVIRFLSAFLASLIRMVYYFHILLLR